MSDPAHYWDKKADQYAAKPVTDPEHYEHKLEVTRRYLKQDSRVLELGCGSGSTALALAPDVAQIDATDFSAKMIEIAQRKAGKAGVSNVHFRCENALNQAQPKGQYDAVLAHSLLHLVPSQEALIAFIYKHLKPGGVFVSTTACLGDSVPWFRWVAPVGRWLGLFPFVSIFSQPQLIEMIQQRGFELEYVERKERAPSVFIVARKPASTLA